MNNLNLLLNTFRSGTTENKIDSIIDLLRRADAAAANTLIELMNSGDQNASIASAFILTIIGRIEGVEFFQTSESLHEHEKSSILSLAARISSSHKLIVPPFSKETQNNLYELLSFLNPITISIDNQFINKLVEVAVKRTIGLILAALGSIERQTGKLEVSIDHNNKALEIGRELRDGRIIGTALGNLGIIFMEMDKYCQALSHDAPA